MAGNAVTQISEKLLSQGWHITPAGLNAITENGNNKDFKSVLQNALNSEIKEIGTSFLCDVLSKKKADNVVVQIQKIRNISAPKANEESQAAPRMLKLTITDGQNYCQAIECENIPGLSIQKTPPGSKLLLKNAKVSSGYIFIDTASCSYLGGKVAALYEKWEFYKNMVHQKRSDVDGDGPPPWVNFGKKITGTEHDNKGFKSLETKIKDEKSTEFDAQRQGAIAVAASGAVKKVFGGGNKPLTSEENKRDYDNYRRDNFDKRESYPNKRDNFENKRDNFDISKRDNFDSTSDNRRERKPQENRDRNGRRGKREPRENEDKLQKPPEKVSLFDFLEDKLPATVPTTNYDYSHKNDYYDRNKPSYNNYNDNKPTQYNKNNNQYNRDRQPNNSYKPNNQYNKSNNQFSKPNVYNKPKQNEYNNTYDSKEFPKPFEKTEKVPYYNDNKPTPPPHLDNLANNFSKMSVNLGANAPFAAKALKQHLNLPDFIPRQSNFQKPDFGGPTRPAANEYQKQSNYNKQRTQSNHVAQFKQPPAVMGVSTQENVVFNQPERFHKNDDFGGPKMNKVQDFGGPKPSFHHQPNNKPEFSPMWQWKYGDQCMAKYWEDNKYYNATISGVTERTCVVQFNEYGNLEEVLFEHCIPITSDSYEAQLLDNNTHAEYPGSPAFQSKKTMEYRRGGNKPFPKKF